MYNTHPHISTQQVSIPPKMTTIVRDRKLSSGSRLENGIGRWVSTVVLTNV